MFCAALDTADSPLDLLSVVHSMPARAEVSEFTRGYPRRFSSQTWTIPGSRTKGKRDQGVAS
jgi:hypothetical protein